MVKSVLKMGLLAVALVAGMSAVRAGSALDTLVMPGANVLLSYDLKAVQSTAIYKKFAAMAEAKKPEAAAKDKMSYEELKKLLEKHGIKENDINDVSLAVALKRVDVKNPESTKPEDVDLMFGMSLKKPVAIEQIEGLANELMAQDGKPQEFKVVKKKLGSYKLLSFAPVKPSPKGDDPELLVGLSDGGKLLFGGLSHSVKDAVKRMGSGKAAAPSAELAKLRGLIPAGAQFSLVVALPEALKQELRKPEPKPANQDMAAAMMGGAGDALKQIDGVAVDATFAQNLDVNINGYFAKPESAQAVNMLVGNLLLMAKMSMGNPNAAKQPKMVETLKCEAAPGASVVKISCSVAPEDLEALKEKAEQQAQMMAMPGMTPPAAPAQGGAKVAPPAAGK